jgi:hypothetical protein
MSGHTHSSRRYTLEASLLGLIVGLAVVAPWTRGGYLLLLDWVSGPNQTLTPGVYGLSGSALDAMPFRIGTQVLRDLVGSAATAWLLILAYFPLAAAGASVAAGGTRWRRLSAALFIVCNPVVVDRVRVGHVAFLLGLALLPWLFASLLEAKGKWFAVRPALWFALAISVSPHAAWLGAVVVLAVALAPRPSWRDVVRSAQIVLSAGLVYSYALVLWVTNTPALRVTDADLSAYATRSGPGGVLVSVATLHGFWRTAEEDSVRVWLGPVVAVLVALVLVAAVVAGFAALWDRERDRAAPLIALVVMGVLLAAGVSGPAEGLYRAAFDTLPLFEAMREQQKWIALVLLGYCVAFAAAVEWVAARWRVGIALGALPLLVAPALVWGLGGSIVTSVYPAGWSAANQTMGRGDGLALFLPWHAYQPFEFSQNRTIATPANAYFARTVLTSDAVELPGLRSDSTSLRTAYVDRLVADGGAGAFGRLVAPLGVDYVILAKTAEADAYTWVAEQTDLQPVLDTPSMTVYRVLASGTGRVVSSRTGTYEQAVDWAAAGELGTEALVTTDGNDGRRSTASGGLHKDGATRWQIDAGAPGAVVVPEEYNPGWQVAGVPGVPTVAGTIAFDVSARPAAVIYEPWRWLLPATVGSGLVLVLLVVAGLIEHRHTVNRALRRDPRNRTPTTAERR